MSNDFIIFAGTVNPTLALAIARRLGSPLSECAIDRFPDGEIAVRLLEPVRRKDVFLVQSTSPPVNDRLVELFAMADACRRAAAERVTAIVPYFGYARADKRTGGRESIMGRVVADVLQDVGISHLVTVDLHTPQVEGFFRISMDALTAVPRLCRPLRDRLSADLVVVSPDAGRTRVAADYAQRLGVPLVVLHKRRKGDQIEVSRIVGDVSNRACLIVDDVISTGATIAESVKALLASGARLDITIAATHGLLLRDARETLDHPAVREVLVTDSVASVHQDWPKLRVVSLAPLIAADLKRFLADGSTGDRGEAPFEIAKSKEETKA